MTMAGFQIISLSNACRAICSITTYAVNTPAEKVLWLSFPGGIWLGQNPLKLSEINLSRNGILIIIKANI